MPEERYNLSAMPRAEAAALLARNVNGDLCVRFYRRGDGTVVTSDCTTSPRVGLHRAMRKLPRLAAGAAGMAGAATVAVTFLHTTPRQPDRGGPEQRVVESTLVPVEYAVLMGAPPLPAQPVE